MTCSTKSKVSLPASRAWGVLPALVAGLLGLQWGGMPVHAQSTTTSTATATTAITAARMLDVERGSIVERPVVIVEGGRIKAVGANLPVPDGAKTLDLGDVTLLPGLIDMHVHLVLPSAGSGTARATLTGYRNAMTTLEAGFTTVRNMGGPAFSGIALRDAIAKGELMGPRIFDAGTLLSVTGGHCSGAVPRAEENDTDGAGTANGPEAFERKVRQQFRQGADFIKACITGGFNSGTDPRVTQFSEAELKAVIDTAHRYGKKVAVHAHGTDAIKLAARLGADSIEHAALVDEEGDRLLRQSQATVVPTLAIAEVAVKRAVAAGAAGPTLRVLQETSKLRRANIARAVRSGVPVMFGTDAPVIPHGTNGTEFAYLVEAGLTNLQAIQSATVKPAAWLNASADIGSIAVGKYADLIAVPGNPLENIKALENVAWVLKGGVIARSPETK